MTIWTAKPLGFWKWLCIQLSPRARRRHEASQRAAIRQMLTAEHIDDPVIWS